MRSQPEASHSRRDGPRGRPAARAAAATRALSLALIAAGALTLAWVLVTLTWQDPITAVETWHHQRALATQLRSRDAPLRHGSVRLESRAYGSHPMTARRWDGS